MILKLEDLIIGTIIRRKYIYLDTSSVKLVEYNNKRIRFYFGFFSKVVVASEYNIKELKKYLGDVDL